MTTPQGQRTYGAEVRERAYKLYEDDAEPSIREIARQVGVRHHSTVQQWIDEGIDSGFIRARPERAEMRKKITDLEEEIRTLRRTITSVRTWLQDNYDVPLDTDLTSLLDSRRSPDSGS